MASDRLEVQKIAKLFITRAEHLNLRGRKRDDAAMEFFVGAAMGVNTLVKEKGDDASTLYDHIILVASLLIATRGYAAVVGLAKDREQEAA